MAQHKYTAAHRLMIEKWSAVGLTLENMGVLLAKHMNLPKPLNAHLISKHFKVEINAGVAVANAAVGGALYNRAINGSVDAQKYWLDRRGGESWKAQQQKVDLTTAGRALEPATAITDEQLDAALKRVNDAV